jgi:stage II sporulation protein E
MMFLQDSTLVNYFEQAVYSVETGMFQLNADKSGVGGDCCEIFSDSSGRVNLLVTDGMGKGEIACVDGVLASDIMSKLICAGFSADSALSITNSVIMVKGDEESFSTVDLAVIDLFTGKVSFHKAGAACSFIRRKGKAGRVELASMPVGILSDARFVGTSITLSTGDIVVVVSDGATVDGYDWILRTLEKWEGDNAPQLAVELGKQAREVQPKSHQDDITVLCAIIT